MNTALPILPKPQFASASQVKLAMQLDLQAIREAMVRGGEFDASREFQGGRFIGFNTCGQFVYEVLYFNSINFDVESMGVAWIHITLKRDENGDFNFFGEY